MALAREQVVLFRKLLRVLLEYVRLHAPALASETDPRPWAESPRTQGLTTVENEGPSHAQAPTEPEQPSAFCASNGHRYPQVPLLDTEISQALDALWSTPALIERFIAQNPAGLNASQLEMVAAWRFSLTDTFVCLEVTPDHLTVMNDERVFDIAATGRPFTSTVAVVPSVVRLTLLPFAGHIVTDGRVIHRLDHLDPAAFPLIMDTLALLGEGGIVETDAELIEYAASRMVSS